jgi:hypothetical protein
MVNIYLLAGTITLAAIVAYIVTRKGRASYASGYAPAYTPTSTPTLGTPNYNGWGGNDTQSHPVLNYQRNQSTDLLQEWPVNYGDPIRGSNVAGPMSTPGPYPGKPMGVPVPAGTLKETNERYAPLSNTNSTSGPGFKNMIGYWYRKLFSGGPAIDPTSADFYRPYGPNVPINTTPFFGNVDAYAPFPEVLTPWEKAGILTSRNGDILLNLFRRPIAPSQDLWEYQVEDKDGFIIKLENKYIEDGTIVRDVLGKADMGPWVAHIFVQNKYVWV